MRNHGTSLRQLDLILSPHLRDNTAEVAAPSLERAEKDSEMYLKKMRDESG